MKIKDCLFCKKEFKCPTKTGIGVWLKRKYCSRACQFKDRPKGERANAWKEIGISYAGIHKWIWRVKGSPRICEKCGTTRAKKFEWANISRSYRRDKKDWFRLCASCHRRYDENWINRERDNLGRFA